MVTEALRHSQTGHQVSQTLRLVMKTALSWLQALEMIRVNGKSNDVMSKILLYVGKQCRESNTASDCMHVVTLSM